MNAKKLDQLNSIRSALEDLHHSQEAVIKKVGQLEVNLMNNPDKEVEDELVAVYSTAADNADRVRDMLNRFNDRVDQANKEFKPAPEEGKEEA